MMRNYTEEVVEGLELRGGFADIFRRQNKIPNTDIYICDNKSFYVSENELHKSVFLQKLFRSKMSYVHVRDVFLILLMSKQ